MKYKTKQAAYWYVSMPDMIRGQEPRVRKTMPAVRDNGTGREVCVLTNYNEGHADLISAAPELLESLEELVKKFNPDEQGTYEFARLSIEKARSLIKKARGEA